MTETTERRGNGGGVETVENQQQVFNGPRTTLGIRQTTPESHIPTAPATVALPQAIKTKTRKESAAARPPLPDLFQDHVVLETLSHFRIIRRLENARQRLFPIISLASVVVLIPDPGKTGAELPPSAARTPEGQNEGSDQQLAETAHLGPEDFSVAFDAESLTLLSSLFARHTGISARLVADTKWLALLRPKPTRSPTTVLMVHRGIIHLPN
jgi:hypothetical protein